MPPITLPAPSRVYIIGGSISGLMHALVILTHSPASHITILERSPTPLLHNQGAGVVAGSEVQGFFDTYVQPGRPIAVRSKQRLYLDRHGSTIPGSVSDHAQHMTSWDVLYRLLRWRVDGTDAAEYLPDTPPPLLSHSSAGAAAKAEYKHRCTLTSLSENEGSGSVSLSWNEAGADEAAETAHSAQADLVIAADGASSTVRDMLLPSVKRTYAGYVALRGTVAESSLSEAAASAFVERFAFFHGPATQVLAYTIPGEAGSLEPGERLVNWVRYVNFAEGSPELEEIMTDTHGKRRNITLPVGGMRPEIWKQQVAAAKADLPPQFAELVRETEHPFVQAITDVVADRNVLCGGRVLLVGDALAGFRPHTAASTGQAAYNAALLGQWLNGQIGRETYARECLRFAMDVQKHGVLLGERSQFGRHPLAD